MVVEIRNVLVDDLAAVRGLNEASVPAVNSLPLEKFDWFRRRAAYFRVAVLDGAVAGFLICLTPDVEYESPNFRWLNEKFRDFFYVDRIAIGVDFQRLGIGRALYNDAVAVASGEYALLACEINVRPRNQQSIEFHTAYGFEAVGEQDNGYVEVQFMVKRL